MAILAALAGCTSVDEVHRPVAMITTAAVQPQDTGPASEIVSSVKEGIFAPVEVREHPAGPPIRLGIVEFDDQGMLRNSRQLLDIKAALDSRPRERPLLLVFFAHGWFNDATPRNQNLSDFRRLLDELRKSNQKTGGATYPHEIMGIYLAWRGASLPKTGLAGLDTALGLASFGSRKHAAERVGRLSCTEAVLTLAATARLQPAAKKAGFYEKRNNVRTIVVGHSFGGLLIERAFVQAMLGYSLMHAPVEEQVHYELALRKETILYLNTKMNPKIPDWETKWAELCGQPDGEDRVRWAPTPPDGKKREAKALTPKSLLELQAGAAKRQQDLELELKGRKDKTKSQLDDIEMEILLLRVDLHTTLRELEEAAGGRGASERPDFIGPLRESGEARRALRTWIGNPAPQRKSDSRAASAPPSGLFGVIARFLAGLAEPAADNPNLAAAAVEGALDALEAQGIALSAPPGGGASHPLLSVAADAAQPQALRNICDTARNRLITYIPRETEKLPDGSIPKSLRAKFLLAHSARVEDSQFEKGEKMTLARKGKVDAETKVRECQTDLDQLDEELNLLNAKLAAATSVKDMLERVKQDPPADLVLLLNPASEAIVAQQLLDIWLPERAGRTFRRLKPSGQREARIISISSPGDKNTRVHFTWGTKGLGRFLVGAASPGRYSKNALANGTTQQDLYTHTAPHLPKMVTHKTSSAGPGHFRLIPQRKDSDALPFWIVEADDKTIKNHTGIFTMEVLGLVKHLVRESGALGR